VTRDDPDKPSPNLDLVRSIYAAWEGGDFSSAEWAHPEIEYVWIGGPAPGSWHGLTDLAKGFRGFLDAWEGLAMRAPEYRELDDQRILVRHEYIGRGKTSGVEIGSIEKGTAMLFVIRNAKVVRLVVYWDPDRALADPGSRQEATSPISPAEQASARDPQRWEFDNQTRQVRD
jgi:ketosteroid isomerase-like protein